MYDLVIVGGGFAGIYSAWRLSKLGLKIAIVEQAHGLGGAMRSQEKLGYLVDIGTHNLDLRTKRDAEFYEDILGSKLAVLDDYKWGSTVDKIHTIGLEGPDFSTINTDLCDKALSEILETDPDLSRASSYLDFINKKFGRTLFDVLTPMIGKVIGNRADTLDVKTAESLGVFSRVKLGSDKEMAVLKGRSSRFDNALSVTLAYPDTRFQGKSVLNRNGYPATGAMLGFCEAAEKRLRALGVDVFLSNQVNGLEETADATLVKTSDYLLRARQIFWSLPDMSLAKLLQFNLDSTSSFMPVGVVIHIFEVMQNDIRGPEYLHDFAPERACFRYARQGCYSHQVTQEGKTFIIAEIPSHPKNIEHAASLRDEAWQNLIDVSFVRKGARFYRHDVIRYPVAYMLPLVGWEERVITANAEFAKRCKNVLRIPFGYRGRDAFMTYFQKSIEPFIAK